MVGSLAVNRRTAQMRMAVDFTLLVFDERAGNFANSPPPNIQEYGEGLRELLKLVAADYPDLRWMVLVLVDFFEALAFRREWFLLERMAWGVINVFLTGLNAPEEVAKELISTYRTRLVRQ